MGIKVAKFGGSSLADGIQIAKMKEIINADPDRKFVVVSAPGKRFSKDNKITDLLYMCREQAGQNLPVDQLFQVIVDRFKSIEMNLGVSIDLDGEFEEIKGRLAEDDTADYAASRGEYLNARIIAEYLGFDFVDSAKMIRFDEKGNLLEQKTYDAIADELARHEYAVIPGFYGAAPDGGIKTFTRGGSDITGALVARAVNAEVYENWTDVSGILAADPKIVKNPKPITDVTYRELRELSYMGANVLHEAATFPVKEAKIPINVRNTNDPFNEGTMITSEPGPGAKDRVITGIAGRKNFVVISVYKDRRSDYVGFIRRIAGIFEDYGLAIEHMPTSVDSVSVAVSGENMDGHTEEIVEEIKRKLHPDEIIVHDDIALITTVGEGMAFKPGSSAKILTALAEKKINIRMIDQGSSELNVIVGVVNDRLEEAIAAIYDAFEGSGRDLKAHFS